MIGFALKKRKAGPFLFPSVFLHQDLIGCSCKHFCNYNYHEATKQKESVCQTPYHTICSTSHIHTLMVDWGKFAFHKKKGFILDYLFRGVSSDQGFLVPCEQENHQRFGNIRQTSLKLVCLKHFL